MARHEKFANGSPLAFSVGITSMIRAAISAKSNANLQEIIEIVTNCGALAYTHKAAVAESEAALNCLNAVSDGPFVEALVTLTNYSTARLS